MVQRHSKHSTCGKPPQVATFKAICLLDTSIWWTYLYPFHFSQSYSAVMFAVPSPQQVWFHKVHSKHISILASSCNRSNDSILTLSPSNFFCSVRFGWLFSSLRQLNHVLKAQRVQSSLAPQECVEDSRDQCLDLSQALKKSCSQQPGTALNVR